VRLIDDAATNEICACASLGRLEHFPRAVEVAEERIDLWRLAPRRRRAGLTASFLLVHIRTVASILLSRRAAAVVDGLNHLALLLHVAIRSDP
jgi:hypothetical protein